MSAPYEKFSADTDRQELLDTPPAPPSYNEVQPQHSAYNMPPPQPYNLHGYAAPAPQPSPYIVQVVQQPAAPAPPPQQSVVVVNNGPGGDTVIVERPCCGVCCRRFCCVLFILVMIGIIGGAVGSQRHY